MARTVVRIFSVVFGVASVLAVTAPAYAQPDDENQLLGEARTVARIVATMGVSGDLGLPVCDGDTDVEPSPFANLTPVLTRLVDAHDQPLLIDTGSLLTPGALVRAESVTNPDELAEMVDELGYRALAFGPNELAASRASMLSAFRALRERGIPGIASNLFCDAGGPATELCEILVDASDGPSIHVVDGRRIAVVAVMAGDTLAALPPGLSEGLRTSSPEEGLTSAVRRARDAGAEMVVAIIDHGNNETDPAGKALALAAALPDDGRPNILLAAGAGRELVFARPPSVRPAIVAAPAGGAVDVRIREDFISNVYDVLARPVIPSVRVAPGFQRWTVDAGRRYCARWARALRGGSLSEPITGRGFLELTAGVVRQRSEAEIGIVDDGLLSTRWRPPTDELTASDAFVALQYDEQIVVADVPAAWLEKVGKTIEEGSYLVAPGLEYDGSKVRVNGRLIEPLGIYRVSTLHFLAAGGAAEALPPLPEGYAWEALEDAAVRSEMLDFLDEPRDGDPREALDDPASDLEWTFRVDLDARLAGTQVDNPVDEDGDPIYSASQLGRNDSLTIGFTSQFRADAMSRDWAWENEGIARYRTTQTSPAPFAEGDDILSLRSVLAYRGLRSSTPRFYVPEPYAEAYLESEFTQPDTRDYYHLLLRPTGGLRFNLTDHLTLKAGAGVTTETLDPMREVLFGFSAQLLLKRWTVMVQEKRKLATEFIFDYFLTGQNQELRGRWDTTLDIAGPFQMVFGFQLFGRKEPDRPIGFAFDATAGLRITWLGRVGP